MAINTNHDAPVSPASRELVPVSSARPWSAGRPGFLAARSWLGTVAVIPGRLVASVMVWVGSSWRFTVPALTVAGLAAWLGYWRVSAALMALVLVAATVAVTVARRWPVGWDRLVADPVRRIVWALWWLLVWRYASQAARLGSWHTDAKRRRVWRPTRAWPLITRAGIRLRVRVPGGATAADVMHSGGALAAAMRAKTATCEYIDAGHVRIRVIMRDALATPTTAARHTGTGAITWGWDIDGRPVLFDPVGSGHIAAQGGTGSGKSTAAYVALAGLAARPDVVVCGCDPSGILLQPFRHGRGGAWIACGTSQIENHADVLEAVVAEMDRRMGILTHTGRDELSDFTADLPVLWVVMEELPGLLAAAGSDRRVLSRITTAHGRIVREGRKVGIRAFSLAQRFSYKVVDPDDRAQYGCRVSLAVDTQNAVQLLHDGDIPTVTEMRTWAPGVALIDRPGQPLTRWRASYMSYREYTTRVRRGIAAHTAGWRAPTPHQTPAPTTRQAPATKPPADTRPGPFEPLDSHTTPTTPDMGDVPATQPIPTTTTAEEAA